MQFSNDHSYPLGIEPAQPGRVDQLRVIELTLDGTYLDRVGL